MSPESQKDEKAALVKVICSLSLPLLTPVGVCAVGRSSEMKQGWAADGVLGQCISLLGLRDGCLPS